MAFGVPGKRENMNPLVVFAALLDYDFRMKSWCIALRVCCNILLALCLALAAPAASAKVIRLRNETIRPSLSPRLTSAQALTPDNPTTGLFLIQFTDALSAAAREQLRSLGVKVLQYVPEDTFIAKFENVRLGDIRRLDFVQWIGPYRPEHKIHQALTHLPPGTTNGPSTRLNSASAPDSIDVAVLLSSDTTPAERKQAKLQFSQIHQESSNHFGVVLRGRINRTQIDSLASSDTVLWIESAPAMRLFDEVSSRIVGGDGPPGQTLTQSVGYNGAGVTVAVADSGLDSGDTNSMHPDIQGRVRSVFYYGAPGQLDGAQDEHGHGTHCAGIVAGNGAAGETDENKFLYGLGIAPGSSLIAQRIFDAAGGYAAPPSFETLTRDAKRAGADIGSNSWGDDTQGQYDLSAMEFDALVRDADSLTLGDQPYIVEFSAGNAGPTYQSIGSPAVAKNVIATGASQNDRFNLPIDEFSIYADGRDAMADFSSRGPCADGRIKPDLVAPGSWIASLRSVYANDAYAWWPISDNYMYEGGTSQAGPHVAGAAAVFVQYWRSTHGGTTPSPALVKGALINSATDMDDGFTTVVVPNNDEGWGRVDLPALIDSSRNYDFTDQSTLLTNGGVFEKRVLIGSADEPLKITLTYTDVPSLPAAAVALINDLDLEVISPTGQIYRGNRFADGESIPDATIPDSINNVEAVHLFAPPPGEYIVRVRGRRVVEDARIDTPVIDQDFALVVSGTFGSPGTGIVTFNRPVYRAPDQIKLVLVDYNLAGQPAANIQLRSVTEPFGETIMLLANGSSGLFTGVVATATGPAVTDGKLQVAHNDTIEAVYVDALPPANRVFSAQVDLLPPVISGLQATNFFGQPTVLWNTDEASRSELYYGTLVPNLGLTNLTLELNHEFGLINLPANAVAKFFVVAQDEAGNRATNNNGGSFFTVTNTQPPTVLVLDSYADNGFIQVPPLSGYTAALDAVGVSYNNFDATSGNLPTPAQLQAYPCVIWRMDEITAPDPALVQRVANYVTNGGSLLLTSMDALSRLKDAGATTFGHDILQVQSNIEDQPVNAIVGFAGDPVGAGIDTSLDYQEDYSDLMAFLELVGVPDPSDWITPTINGAPVMLSDGQIVGVRSPKTGVELPGRVVFLSFPLDTVPLGSGIGNNRAGLLQNILNFLSPAPNASSLTLDSDVYSLPGRAIMEVEDADLRGQSSVVVTVHSPQHPEQLNVTLLETTRAGLFRGSVLFAPTNTTTPGVYALNANDTVQVDYFDASANKTNSVSATIETNAPVISNVAVEPGYLEAYITWDTSEDADSLAQYGESPNSLPNNYTAYDPLPITSHELFLGGLKPNTTYYVRVTSRDRAGNTTIDDNNGQLYTFHTLQPGLPPWSDNMETNNVEWSVITADESESAWTRGTPGGGETAHSGTNCWGSNLSGSNVGIMESYLISPGVLLTGGNHATLRFWQNYDFLAQGDYDIQLAAIEIITNVATSPVLLYQFPEDYSAGWEQFEFDLTPYIGNVVYIVWYHFLFSLDASPRLGWLVDDVSIATSTIVPGTVQITNNLWQSIFALSGPSGRNGSGRWTAITNAAPGEYVIQYGDAAYYLTPAPQTNTLTPGGTVTFTGNYTSADANTNGLPDAYETEKFGAVNPLRTDLTDTDGDGLSDWAEFVAGTDPTNSSSSFQLSTTILTNNQIQLTWPSAPGHGYRILGSTNTITWLPFSDWIRVTSYSGNLTLPPRTNGAPDFFRLEAQP